MPDWTYRTIFRPLLFSLKPETGRELALGAMGRLARLPGGRHLIEFMGHLRPARALRSRLGDFTIETPVGLAPGVDPHHTGLAALCRFGFGFVEIGPITPLPIRELRSTRDIVVESVQLTPSDCNLGATAIKQQLDQLARPRPAIIVRLGPHASPGEDLAVIDTLGEHPAAFSVVIPNGECDTTRATAWRDRLSAIIEQIAPRPLFIVVPVNRNETDARPWCDIARETGARGVIVGRAELADHAEMGRNWLESAKRWTQCLLADWGKSATLIAAAGIHAPLDAEQLMSAGADLVQIDSGIVFTGPGLPKRVNELVLHRRLSTAPASMLDDETPSPARFKWVWTLLLGASMLIGGVMALAIAATRVVMPYDEAMAGLTRDQIDAINPRLLSFMTHDRVTLAGAMLAVGILFTVLSWHGVRRGLHWAQQAVLMPAFVGFLSFFSFLGFGYFDPLHAFVTSILFQFMLLAIVARPSPLQPWGIPDRHNDSAWQRAQWGQLTFVIHGAALLIAGLVISGYGMTRVFVESDLSYLEMCIDDLSAVPRLVPLVAHDRGTFGGMLVVAGLTVILSSLWGFRRGASWLWWGLQIAGAVGYVTTIIVHHVVGYVDPLHLAPAYGGLAALCLGGLLSAGYLCDTTREQS
jgi:dihydroorotate dehydrogenase